MPEKVDINYSPRDINWDGNRFRINNIGDLEFVHPEHGSRTEDANRLAAARRRQLDEEEREVRAREKDPNYGNYQYDLGARAFMVLGDDLRIERDEARLAKLFDPPIRDLEEYAASFNPQPSPEQTALFEVAKLALLTREC